METTTSTEVVKFNELATEAPQVLEQNKLSVSKATEVTNQVLNEIQQTGMNDNLDTIANNLIVKLRTTLTNMNTKRKWITQQLDMVKKQFTTAENDVKALADNLQLQRNNYALKKLEEQRKREAEEQRKREKAEELLNFKTACLNACNDSFFNILGIKKQNLQRIYDNLSLENFEDFRKKITGFPQEFPLADYNVQVVFPIKHMSIEDKNLIIEEVKAAQVARFNSEYRTAINNQVSDLVSKLQSKKSELEQIAAAEKADAAEAARLKQLADQRKEEERKRLADESAKAKAEADAQAAVKSKEAEIQSLFDATPSVNAVERTGYDILVKHPNAWPLMVQLWFEREGKDLDTDTLEKKTFKQIKTFCEKLAHKDDVKIDSKYIEYKEDVKTRAK